MMLLGFTHFFGGQSQKHGDILSAHARRIMQCITLYSMCNTRTVNNAVWNAIYRAQRTR